MHCHSINHYEFTPTVQAGYDLSSISFFQRGTAQEFITFTSRILVERTALGARPSVKECASTQVYDKPVIYLLRFGEKCR